MFEPTLLTEIFTESAFFDSLLWYVQKYGTKYNLSIK